MLSLLGLLLCLPQATAAWFFFRGRGGTGLFGNWIRTAGWLSLWTLPAGLAQLIFLAAGFTSTTFAVGDLFAMLPWSWPVLLGGVSVQMVFEETAKALSGHRQSTLIDNLGLYLFLTWLQLAVLALFCALARDETRRHRDRVSLTLGVAMLINALLGITWPWWGT